MPVGAPVGQRWYEQRAVERLVRTDTDRSGAWPVGRGGLPNHTALSRKVVLSDWRWTTWKCSSAPAEPTAMSPTDPRTCPGYPGVTGGGRLRKMIVRVQPARQEADTDYDGQDAVIATLRWVAQGGSASSISAWDRSGSVASALLATRRPVPWRPSTSRAWATNARTAETTSRHQVRAVKGDRALQPAYSANETKADQTALNSAA